MTEDVILDVTADFIRSSKTNLKLALQVERALPSVREHFVRVALEAVEERFSGSEWTVDQSGVQNVMARYAQLQFTSSAWNSYRDEASIWLSSDQPGWKRVWTGLYFTGRSSRKVRPVEQTMEPLVDSGYTVQALEQAPGAFKHLDGELQDWSGERFLTRILEDEPGGIASEIATEMMKLDEFVRSLPQ